MRFFFLAFVIVLHSKASILMSGSSTVYPFAIVIAEEFAYKTNLQTPIVESVGTGGGFSAFCRGNDVNSPDIVNASRPIKQGEKSECIKNNVSYTSIPIGLDAIVLAVHSNSKYEDIPKSLTEDELFKALARNVLHNGEIITNPYNTWSDINPKLPNVDIVIYGPPSTSGTRDSFTEIALTNYCIQIPAFHEKFKEKTKQACSLIRNDGRFIESGENDAFIVHKISLRNGAVGIFGYSHYMENKTKLQAIAINGISPNNYSISTTEYKIARPLFLYFKNASLKEKPEVKLFYKEASSEEAIGFGGYLEGYHLIPLDKQFLANHKLNEMDNTLTLSDV
jgi:phosphate transport system substrate-binding protein